MAPTTEPPATRTLTRRRPPPSSLAAPRPAMDRRRCRRLHFRVEEATPPTSPCPVPSTRSSSLLIRSEENPSIFFLISCDHRFDHHFLFFFRKHTNTKTNTHQPRPPTTLTFVRTETNSMSYNLSPKAKLFFSFFFFFFS